MMQEILWTTYDGLERTPPRVLIIPNPNPIRNNDKVENGDGHWQGGGTTYLSTCHLRNRFIRWKSCGSRVDLMEESLDQDLHGNVLTLEFPFPICRNGGTVHRVGFLIPEARNEDHDGADEPMKEATYWSIFSLKHSVNTAEDAHMVLFTTSRSNPTISCVLWRSICNASIGTSTGQVYFLNWGMISGAAQQIEWAKSITLTEFSQTQHTAMQSNNIILSMTMIMHEQDLIICTLHSCQRLQLWSMAKRQSIADLDISSLFHDQDDSGAAVPTFLRDGKIEFLSAYDADDCRLLLATGHDLWCLCGSLPELDLQRSRLLLSTESRFVDWLVTKMGDFFSLWTGPLAPKIFAHGCLDADIGSSTGPKGRRGGPRHHTPASSPEECLHTLSYCHERLMEEDEVFLDTIVDHAVEEEHNIALDRVHTYFIQRVFIPGRFPLSCIEKAVEEMLPEQFPVVQNQTRVQFSTYQDCYVALNKHFRSHFCQSIEESISSWTYLISLCSKYWSIESSGLTLCASPIDGAFPSSVIVLRQGFTSFLCPVNEIVSHPKTNRLCWNTSYLSTSTSISSSVMELEEYIGMIQTKTTSTTDDSIATFVQKEIQKFSYDNGCMEPYLSSSVVTAERGVSLDTMLHYTKSYVRHYLSDLISSTLQSKIVLAIVIGLGKTFDAQSSGIHQILQRLAVPPCRSSSSSVLSGSTTALDENYYPDPSASIPKSILNQIQSLFTSSSMNSGWNAITRTYCQSRLHQTEQLVIALTFLVETQPHMCSSQMLLVMQQAIVPRALVCLRFWSTCLWLSSQRCQLPMSLHEQPPCPTVEKTGVLPPTPSSAVQPSFVAGETVFGGMLRLHAKKIYTLLLLDIDEDGALDEELKDAVKRYVSGRSNKCSSTSQTSSSSTPGMKIFLSCFSTFFSYLWQQPHPEHSNNATVRMNELLTELRSGHQYPVLYPVLRSLYLDDSSVQNYWFENGTPIEDDDDVIRSLCLDLQPILPWIVHSRGSADGRRARNNPWTRIGTQVIAETFLHFANYRVFAQPIEVSAAYAEATRLYLLLIIESESPDSKTSLILECIDVVKKNMKKGPHGSTLLRFVRQCVTHWETTTSIITKEEGKQEQVRIFFWLNVFKYALDLCEYAQAFLAWKKMMTTHSQEPSAEAPEQVQDCLRRLVLVLCERNKVQLLCQFPWQDQREEVEKMIEWQAINTDLRGSGRPAHKSFYHVLYAYHMYHHHVIKAATAMYHFQHRVFVEKHHLLHNRTNVETLTRMFQTRLEALLVCVHTLRLVSSKEDQWILSSSMIAPHHSNDSKALMSSAESSKGLKLKMITMTELNQELALLQAQRLLVQKKIKREHHHESVCQSPHEWSVHEILSLLVEQNEIQCAIDLAKQFHIPLHAIVRKVATDCCDQSSSSSKAWAHLKTLLLECDSVESNFELHELAVDSILCQRPQMELPVWLTESFVGKNHRKKSQWVFAGAGANPAALLRLYLQHGLLLEACSFLQRFVPSSLDKENPTHMRWFPYALIDTLFDCCAQVLENQHHRPVTMADPGHHFHNLKTAYEQVRTSFGQYFHSLKSIEQARKAGAYAQASELRQLKRSKNQHPNSSMVF